MNGRAGLLALLLLVQVLIIGAIWLSRDKAADVAQTLLPFSAADITRIEINEPAAQVSAVVDTDAAADAGGATATLLRSESGWSMNDMPVAQSKVAALLDKLSSINSPWPVATSAQAQERFSVTDEQFHKQVRLFAGQSEVAVLLLGTSPGFKRIHARRPGEDAVFSIALTSLDLPVKLDDWLDNGLLAAEMQVNSISRIGHWQAALQEELHDPAGAPNWSLTAQGTGPAPAIPADPAVISALIDRFAQLQVIGMATPESTAGEPTDTFELRDATGQLVRYQLHENTEQDRFSMVREGVSGGFEVAGYIAEQMRKTLADLVNAPKAESATAQPDVADE